MIPEFRAWNKKEQVYDTAFWVKPMSGKNFGFAYCNVPSEDQPDIKDVILEQHIGNRLYHNDIVKWKHVFDRSIYADYTSAEFKVELTFVGKITLSLHTGTWITKVSRRSKVLINTYNKKYLGDKYDYILMDADNLRLKFKRHWKLVKLGNIHQNPELLEG